MAQSGLVLYDKNCSWEIDYVLSCLLKPLFEDDNTSFVCQLLDTKQILEFADVHSEKRILVFTSNLVSFNDLKPFVKRFKPHVVIHMSDEWGTKPEFVELADLAPLVLRQHWFPNAYSPRSNIFPIPLGVMTGFPLNAFCIKPMLERKFSWAFIGTINAPRQAMLDKFDKLLALTGPHFVAAGGVPIAQVAAIYNDAVFVPNERGAVRLDCFRLYEATLSGAIPVVVGSQAEIADTFVHDHDTGGLPPWVFASSWEVAAQQCVELLLSANRLVLQQMQTKNVTWFQKCLTSSQRRIARALAN